MVAPTPLSTPPATDLVDRFRAILAALHPEGASWTTATWMRFAALSLVPEPGEPGELAHQVRADAARLRAISPWWTSLASPLRFLIASLLRSGGLTAEAFVGLVGRDREMLGELGLHPHPPFDVVATAVRALLGGNHPLSELAAERIKVIHDGLKGHHWWLMGPEDLPACALAADLAFLELVRSPHHAAGPDAPRCTADLDEAGRMLAKLRLYQAAAAVIAVDCWQSSFAGAEVPPPGFWPT